MSVVSIVKGNGRDVYDVVGEAIRLAGGFKSFIKRDSRVLIKPNLASPSPSGSGAVTDCRVTEAVTKLVMELNPKSVVIGEGSGYGYDVTRPLDSRRGMQTMDAFRVSGTLDVAERLGVEVVDLNRDTPVEVTVPTPLVAESFIIAKTVADSDVIINVPVMKTHYRTIITISYKNMKGVLRLDEKRKTHRLGLDQGIVDLNRTVKSSFTVVDGLTCRLGGGLSDENLAKVDLIVAGRDGVAVDTVCAKVMGFDPERIRTITLAVEEGLGVGDLDKIQVRGAAIESVVQEFEDPQRARAEAYPGVTFIDAQTCSACEGEFHSPLFYIREAGLVKRLEGLTVVMGEQAESPVVGEKTIFVGKCVQGFKDQGAFVDGCPPRGWALTEKVCEVCGIDKEEVIAAIEKIHDKLSEIR